MRGGRFGIESERLQERIACRRKVAFLKKQICQGELERNTALLREFLDLLPGGPNIFVTSRRFSQRDNGIAIIRDLLEDFECFFFCIGEPSYGQVTAGQPYSILSVLRIQLACLCQKGARAQGDSVLQPHRSDSFECERVLRIQL